MSATECDSMDHVGNGCIETGNSIVDRVPVSSTRFQRYPKVRALAVNYFVYKMDVCVVCQQDFEKDHDRKSYNRRRITLRVRNRNCTVLDITQSTRHKRTHNKTTSTSRNYLHAIWRHPETVLNTA